MIWHREEYIALMNHEDVGREFFCELFGTLIGLDREWKSQGASEDEINLSAFGFDGVKVADPGLNVGALSGKKEVVIEDNDEYRVSIDELGREMRLCKDTATLPLPQSYPVTNMDDWLRIKPWFEFNESRVDKEKLLDAKKLQDDGALVVTFMNGGFDLPRDLMGEETLCLAYYEEPELIYDILETVGAMTCQVYERALDVLSIDNLSVHEDMAGKNGPLIGPHQVEEFINPYYTKIWKLVQSCGCTIFSQDSDGDMTPVIDSFLNCGVNVMYPFEPAAGMDMVEVRKKYGKRLGCKGGIDKFTLMKSKKDIQAELEYKLGDVMRHGGTVFAIDHRIPTE